LPFAADGVPADVDFRVVGSPLNSVVATILPLIGLVLGIVVGVMAGKRQTPGEDTGPAARVDA